MLKGIVICFLFLAVQLAFLAHVDHRQSRSRSEITYTAHNLTPQSRQRTQSAVKDEGDLPSKDDGIV